MALQDNLDNLNLSQYFIRFRLPGGHITGATFDDELSIRDFGEEATSLITDIRHFTGNPPSTEELQVRFKNEKRQLIEKFGISAEDLSRASRSAKIEDL